jgi:histidyl-tRNA synthetase
MTLENTKGTRDIYPQEKIVREKVIAKLKTVFEKYGFSPLETPIIEKLDVLTAKAGAGEESDASKEIFKVSDQGGRDLGLRFDLTVPFARFIGMNPTLKMPFKRYQVEPVFRDGPIKLGRYRQFWQCDVDVVGSKNMITDAEILSLALDVFKELELDAYLEVNNRKILKGIIGVCGIEEEKSESVIITIDKLKKIGREGVIKELSEKNISKESSEKLVDAFNLEGSNEEKITKLKELLKNNEGLKELEEMLSYLSKEQKEKINFNISLARGLSYYTGTIFEGFMKKSKITSSICGGGRYDELVSKLLGSKKEYPCIGISFGLDVIADVMKLEGKITEQKTTAKVFVVPIKTEKECFEICKELRDSGINADMDQLSRSISKNLDYADKYQIPYVLIVGSRELEEESLI